MKFAWHSGCHFNSPTIHVYLCQYLYLRGAYLYLNLDLSMSVYIYTLNILSIYQSICLSIYLSTYLYAHLPVYPPTYLPINQSSYPIQSNLSTIPILSYPILSYLIYLIYLSNLIQFNLSYLICLCNRTYLFIYLYIYSISISIQHPCFLSHLGPPWNCPQLLSRRPGVQPPGGPPMGYGAHKPFSRMHSQCM